MAQSLFAYCTIKRRGVAWTVIIMQAVFTSPPRCCVDADGFARFGCSSCQKQVRLVLPEGLEVSKLFYFWLSTTLHRYLGKDVTSMEEKLFRENVFGISLSATGLSEVG